MADFAKQLKKLNPEQLAAVQSIEGPVMVVAGPGTGKTQTVALRIAQILQTTHAQATNVLALTFTEAGVTALRRRLTDIIGPLAYRVSISTFHGFASEVISTFPHIFAVTRNLTQLDDLERLLIVEQLILADPTLTALKPLRQETSHVKAIAAAIRQAKQEAITAEQIRQFAANIEPEAGKTKAQVERLKRQKAVLGEFAKIYNGYHQALIKKSVYDYEDMILFVLAALADNAEVKAYFQERYQYILVDEYQDTNNAQNKLVEILADFFDTPNLFVVGDDKQAIYRFQGASVANMLHFHKKYSALTIISLTKNYRSSPQILASAEALISNNQHQLATYLPKINTKLLAANVAAPKPELLVLPTTVAEQHELTRRIIEFQAAGTPWEEIAVLFRTNAEANTFRDAAEKAGIAVAGVQTTDLLQEKEIQLLLQIFRAIVRPTDDVATAAAIKANIKPEQILDLVELIKQSRQSKQKIIELAVVSPDAAIKDIALKILNWSQRQATLSIPELIQEVLYESSILESVRARPHHLAGLELIAALITHARDYVTRNQASTLADWLDYLELHQTYNLPFSINRTRAGSVGVFINTVHQAKGLEFEVVFIPNSTDKMWRIKPSRSVVKLPPELISEDPDADELDDLRRLFYVAVTRAKKSLFFSYPLTDADGRDQLPSVLIAEILPTLEQKNITPDEAQLSSYISSQLTPLPENNLTEIELSFIREKAASLAMSFTAYWDYKTCPRTYLLSHIYCLPSPFVASLVYGSAVHKAIELFSREHKSFKKLPTKERLQELFMEALTKDLPFGQRETFVQKGIDVLGDYYTENLTGYPPPLDVEYSFRPHQVMLDDIWLTGKIDRIEPIDRVTKTVRIIDFKTGSESRTRNYIEGKTQDSDGKYKAQLVFYALLASIDPHFPYQAKEFEIRFVDDKKVFKSEVFTISKDEIKALAADIKKCHQEILTRTDFPIGNAKSELALLFPSLS